MYGIYTYIWLIFMVNVGKYASLMDPMGFRTSYQTLQGNKHIPPLEKENHQYSKVPTARRYAIVAWKLPLNAIPL